MGVLKAAEKMALEMKDKNFAKKCSNLFVQGSKWMDAHLFNGEYYEHKITDPQTFANVITGLREIPSVNQSADIIMGAQWPVGLQLLHSANLIIQ